MRDINMWLDLYGQSHQNPINKKIHRVCVPLIMISLLGLLSLIPSPNFLKELGLNFGKATILLAIIYYFVLSRLYCFFMVLLIIPMFLIVSYFINKYNNTFNIILWLSTFIISWIGQFIGHKIEGKKPSFLEDISFLLIGPLWIIRPLIIKIQR